MRLLAAISPCGGMVDALALGASVLGRGSSSLPGGTNQKQTSMKQIECPKCKKLTTLNIAHTIDEEGEVFKCEHCGWPFRYVKH